jgi:dipeptidyl aminopeptidase/acylaminoacyl peptidase
VADDTWSAPSPAPDAFIVDPVTHRQIGQITASGDEIHYVFFDPADQKVWNALTAAYKGDKVDLVSASDNRRRFILRVDSATDGPAYALVDLDTGKGVWIGDEYAGLKPADVSPVRAISLKARDGLPLSGYLTLPRDRPDKKLPLVVLPHGGPGARDAPGFDWWAQALASRGYAVLQLNYRGSYGFGWSFQSAGFGEWGRKMQTDLSDGVRYLAGEGVIDPARVCIVGGSYGGYAALAGVTLDPVVYRCAASIAGPSDLARMVDDAKFDAAAERFWLRYMGPRNGLADISPAAHADKVAVPVLLIHGKDDTVVPYEQSQIMADALRKAGKSVEFVTLKREDHWLSQGETRLEMLQAVTAFLEKNNPAD